MFPELKADLSGFFKQNSGLFVNIASEPNNFDINDLVSIIDGIDNPDISHSYTVTSRQFGLQMFHIWQAERIFLQSFKNAVKPLGGDGINPFVKFGSLFDKLDAIHHAGYFSSL